MNRQVEIVVGVFIAIGLGALVVLSMQVSGINELRDDEGYRLTARFSNIGQLRAKAPIRLGGAVIGKVTNIGIDPDSYEIVVGMNISPDYRLPLDTSAGIYTSGLLGEQYVALTPGGEEDYLQPGETITITSDAVVLEDVISRFLYNQAAEKRE